jgi:thiamine biosynthesis lipoprotein
MRRCRPLLGTYVEVTADDVEHVEAAFAAIARIHALMSAHESNSDISRINRLGHAGAVEVSNETRDVLERSLAWSQLSNGIFDIVRAGAQSLASRRIPRHEDQPAPEAADSSALALSANAVRLLAPACLDVGGIAKGFAVDQAVAAMRRAGAARGLVNAGGDLFAFGPEPRSAAVVHPQTRVPAVEVELIECGLATSALLGDGSGDHLPSGTDWMSVTVRAQSACDADALTKIAWAAPARLGELLNHWEAVAFGIRPNGLVEAIELNRLAA